MLKYIKRLVPKAWRPYLNKRRWNLMIKLAELEDSRSPSAEALPVPPAHLRFRVHGSPKREGFLTAGRATLQDLLRLVRDAKHEVSEFESVLDFGCGCGRILRHLHDEFPDININGADIDQEAIGWCKANLPFGRYAVNGMNPPMEFPDRQFDWIFGNSVFTHLNEEMQNRWLKELHRVARPGSLLILSVLGASTYRDELPADSIRKLEQDGIFFMEVGGSGKNKMDDLPDFYQLTYHTEAYIGRVWGENFEILKYVPQAIGGLQDAVILTPR